MKTQIIKNEMTGYGHRRITILFRNGKEYSTVTTDMQTTDKYNSDFYTKKEEREVKAAEKRLIWYVKRDNNLK